TYNRPALFAEALAAIRAQSRPVDGIVVVDNASDEPVSVEQPTPVTDAVAGPGAPVPDAAVGPDAPAIAPAIAPALSPRPAGPVRLIRLERNTGGAGGFAVGIAVAVETERADLVWIMDDDTVPTDTALEELLAVQRRAPASARLFGSRALWTDGRPHPMNEPRRRPFASRSTIEAAAAHGAVPVRSLSFVSLLVDARAVRELGLPVADYFLWNDDFEYTARILRRHTGYFVPASLVVHKTAVFGSTDADPGPRFRNEVRNKLWMFGRSRALDPLEWAAYAGSSALRWGRTVLRSSDRALLGAGFRAGLAEARHAPRPNVEALADAPDEALAAVRTIERAASGAAPVAGDVNPGAPGGAGPGAAGGAGPRSAG
ncbi:glycosyltransferase, partial [Galbitalea sp. SE-J8]|uniref:glycosyltransferase n=1 Tax=Galbitalea sp. SE-J8 TaxID=3054952 RepID=UPI00259C7F54